MYHKLILIFIIVASFPSYGKSNILSKLESYEYISDVNALIFQSVYMDNGRYWGIYDCESKDVFMIKVDSYYFLNSLTNWYLKKDYINPINRFLNKNRQINNSDYLPLNVIHQITENYIKIITGSLDIKRSTKEEFKRLNSKLMSQIKNQNHCGLSLFYQVDTSLLVYINLYGSFDEKTLLYRHSDLVNYRFLHMDMFYFWANN